MDFRIRQLQCFLTLSELLNFGKTARALYISQPTITFQIQSLEDAFHIKLFERDRTHVRLTEAGVAFRQYAQSIMDTIAVAQQHFGNLESHLRVKAGWGPAGLFDLLPAVLRVLWNKHPTFDLEVQDLTTEQQMDYLAKRVVDALVMVPSLPIQGATFHPLCRVPLVAIVPRKGLLAERGRISVHDLRETSIVATRAEDCRFQRPFLVNLLAPFGIQPKIVESPQSWGVQSAYVASGAGIMIAPKSRGFEDLPEVMPIPFVEPLPWIELGCMSMQNNQTEAVIILRRVVAQSARSIFRDLAGENVQKPKPRPSTAIAFPSYKNAV